MTVERSVANARRALLPVLERLEHRRIELQVIIEREWWGGSLIENEVDGLNSGELIHVPHEMEGYRLIWKLRSGEEPDTLRPVTYELLCEIVSDWYKFSEDEQVNIEGVYLSVSSLYRSEVLQERLRTDYRATSGISLHSAGTVIDFDPNGYYSGDRSINRFSEDYDPAVTQILFEVLQKMQSQGKCHLIEEVGYRFDGDGIEAYLSCLHVCVSPDYLQDI